VCNIGRKIGRVSAKRQKEYCNGFSLSKRGKAPRFLNLPKRGKMKTFGESSTMTWRRKMLGYDVKGGGLEGERSGCDTLKTV